MKKKMYLYCLLIVLLLLSSASLYCCDSPPKDVTVKIVTNIFLEVPKITGKPNSVVENFAMPEAPDNEFKGLFKDSAYEKFYGMTISHIPEKDITLYAQYVSNKVYKVSFSTDGAEPIKSLSIVFGEGLDKYIPDLPEKNGFIFDGWWLKPLGSEDNCEFDFNSQMPAHNITLYAKWLRDAEKKFIRFIVCGEVYKEVVLDKDSEFIRPEDPKLENGLAFDDWYISETSSTKAIFSSELGIYSLERRGPDGEEYYCAYGNVYTVGLGFQGNIVSGGAAVFARDNIVIPWTINGQVITKIADHAFENHKVKNISLPETLLEIGERAFAWCAWLDSVDLPQSLLLIGAGSFDYNSSLGSINIPKNTDIDLREAFVGCNSLKDIYIEDGHSVYMSHQGGVYSLDGTVFVKCAPGLTDFIVEEGVKTVLYNAFDSYMLSRLTIPNSVDQIENGAINIASSALIEIILPAVPNSVYSDGTASVEIFNLAAVFGAEKYSDNVGTNINLYSLFVPTSLERVELTSISTNFSYSFYGCFYIKDIILPQYGLYDVGAGSFFLCYNLRKIEIPDSVISISGGSVFDAAFYYCENLKSIKIPFLGASAESSGYLSYIFGAPSYDSVLQFTDGNSIPYTFYLEDVVVSGIGMTEIAVGAFYGNISVRKITIGSEIKTIGHSAFYACSNLEEITGTDGVRQLTVDENYYSGTFAYCFKLREISLPQCNNGIIGKDAFLGVGTMGGFSSFEIQEGITRVESGAFQNCTNLTNIVIPASVTHIGAGAFYNCSSLGSLKIPAGVSYIGFAAFELCNKLTTLEMPMINIGTIDKDGVTAIEVFSLPVYFGAHNITSNKYKNAISYGYHVPQSLKGVVFNFCATDVKVYYSFYDCEFLESVSLPVGIPEIGEQAFSGCKALPLLTIPQSVTFVASGAFGYNNISEFSLASANTSFCVKDGVLYSFDMSRLISYPSAKKSETFTVPDTVTEIVSFAFTGNSYIKTIVLPNGLISVGSAIFQNCAKLTCVSIGEAGIFDSDGLNEGMLLDKNREILFAYYGISPVMVIPDTVNEIKPYVFNGLHYLTRIEIGKNVTTIGEFAFGGVSAQIIFNTNAVITRINSYAFAGYQGDSISIPDNIVCLEEGAFSHSGLSSVIFGANSDLVEIGDKSFYMNAELVGFDLPAATQIIGRYAFYFNEKMESFAVPANSDLRKVMEYAFMNCSLEYFYIPSLLEEIGAYAFSYNSLRIFDAGDADISYIGEYAFLSNALQSIYLPRNIEYINEGAFAYNSPLSELVMSEGLLAIGDYAFHADTRLFGLDAPLSMLSNIRIPASVVYIGVQAFYGVGHYAMPITENKYAYYTSSVTLTFASGSMLEEIGSQAFGMIRFVRTIPLDLSVTKLRVIGSGAFFNLFTDRYSLKSVIFPQTLEVIGNGAFLGQVSLSEVVIPSSVRQIGAEAFAYCMLTKVIFGSVEQLSAIENIGDNCFDSPNLKIYIYSFAPPVLGNFAFHNSTSVFVLSAAFETYRDAWEQENFEIYQIE